MSDDNFIARWSRLKREAESEKRRAGKPGADADLEPPETRTDRSTPSPALPSVVAGEPREAADPPFDPATLPPIESIDAATDIRAFLQKGVPAALTNAALRRVWAADPAIRDFIEIAENQWDFTNPASIPGFGPLEATGEAQRLLGQAIGTLSDAPDGTAAQHQSSDQSKPAAPAKPDQGRPPAEVTEPSAAAAAPEPARADGQSIASAAAPQHEKPVTGGSSVQRRRGHGTAMPR
jgi:hypothetical protein